MHAARLSNPAFYISVICIHGELDIVGDDSVIQITHAGVLNGEEHDDSGPTPSPFFLFYMGELKDFRVDVTAECDGDVVCDAKQSPSATVCVVDAVD
jgi:hypothetical protein